MSTKPKLVQSDPDLVTSSGERNLGTKSGLALNRGQILLISYIGGNLSSQDASGRDRDQFLYKKNPARCCRTTQLILNALRLRIKMGACLTAKPDHPQSHCVHVSSKYSGNIDQEPTEIRKQRTNQNSLFRSRD
eukprot:sb/3474793/